MLTGVISTTKKVNIPIARQHLTQQGNNVEE
jgi:hypothetical protein